MEQQVSAIIEHMAESQQKIARILLAERQIVQHIAQIISEVDRGRIRDEGTEAAIAAVSQSKKDLAAYLHSLADLQEALSENLQVAISELSEQPAEE